MELVNVKPRNFTWFYENWLMRWTELLPLLGLGLINLIYHFEFCELNAELVKICRVLTAAQPLRIALSLSIRLELNKQGWVQFYAY